MKARASPVAEPGGSVMLPLPIRNFSFRNQPVETSFRDDPYSGHATSLLGEKPQMTLTVAHISPIMSVIAGLLILIMPRLLNFVVAIFLILNGLIGLGLLKWLHI